jgi:type I restriction-modification system DNA methylase subunit
MDYYATVLEPLFFDTLNQQRPNLESKWGKIPYLNGGLFDRDYGTGIKDAAGRLTPDKIELPNSLFDPGDTDSILGFFNSYNFTIAENVAGDEDVAVDPEMLGKVFENMLAAEERGQSGTFYTPRGIVQFMCSEVLAIWSMRRAWS